MRCYSLPPTPSKKFTQSPKRFSFWFAVWRRRVNFRRFDVCFCSAHFHAHTSNPISIVLLLAYGKYFHLSVCTHINCFVLTSFHSLFRSLVFGVSLFKNVIIPILGGSIFGQHFRYILTHVCWKNEIEVYSNVFWTFANTASLFSWFVC